LSCSIHRLYAPSKLFDADWIVNVRSLSKPESGCVSVVLSREVVAQSWEATLVLPISSD
jgi:hypothetical protein